MNKTFSRQFVLLLVNLMTVACAQPSAPAASSAETTTQSAVYEIKIDNFSFSPQTLTVPVGATVKWTNHDDIPHNIVSSDQKFKSKPLDTNDSFSFTFDQPGTYQYFCGLHPKMVGKVIVEAKK